jgi:hypothetical protein
MKYETPQLTASTAAISAIQEPGHKGTPPNIERPGVFETPAYADWE